MAGKLKAMTTYLAKSDPLRLAVEDEAAERRCSESMVIKWALMDRYARAHDELPRAEAEEVARDTV